MHIRFAWLSFNTGVDFFNSQAGTVEVLLTQ
jgi:hypothetical protein